MVLILNSALFFEKLIIFFAFEVLYDFPFIENQIASKRLVFPCPLAPKNKFILEFIKLEKNGKLPNKILLSGQKGIGKSTLAYHLINYILSQSEDLAFSEQDTFNNYTFVFGILIIIISSR